MIKVLKIWFILASICSAHAGRSALPAELKGLDLVLAKYRNAVGVAMTVEKRTFNGLTNQEKKSEGRLYYSRKKMRLEIDKPDVALLVMDGKLIWFVTKTPEDMGGKTIVSKTSNRAVRKGNSVMSALFDNRRLFEEFKLDPDAKDNGPGVVNLVPRIADSTEILRIRLEFDEKKSALKRVLYFDDRENEVSFTLGSPDFKSVIKPEQFSYKPPKEAEVTEF